MLEFSKFVYCFVFGGYFLYEAYKIGLHGEFRSYLIALILGEFGIFLVKEVLQPLKELLLIS